MTASLREVPLEQLGEFLASSPFHRLLGITLRRAQSGEVEVALPFRKDFLADPDAQYVHGGVIATLIDVAGCFAVISAVGHDVPTLDLRVDYLRPAGPELLTAVGKAVRTGRTFGVADVEVRDPAGRVVAMGRGLFGTGT